MMDDRLKAAVFSRWISFDGSFGRMSAYGRTTDFGGTSRHVRKVPIVLKKSAN
jgi:hypothetical protein